MLSLLSTTQVGLMGKLWFSSGVMWAVCWQSMGSFGLPFYLQRVSVVRLGTEPKNMWYNLSTSYSFFCCCWSISQLRQKFLHLKSWSETKWKNSVHCSHCLCFLFLFFFFGQISAFHQCMASTVQLWFWNILMENFSGSWPAAPKGSPQENTSMNRHNQGTIN